MQDLAGFLPFVLIALVFWFLIIRPQRRRQQELASTQGSVAPGTEVMLGSGIYGTVAAVDEDTLQLVLAPGTTIKVARAAVVRVIEPSTESTGSSTGHAALDDTDPRHDSDPSTPPTSPEDPERPHGQQS